MEIAFFSETYLPTRDGVAAVVSGLARALEQLGHSVRVFTAHPQKGAPTDEVEIDGVTVVRCRSVPVPLYGEYRWAVFPFAQMRARWLPTDVDLIHLHTPGIIGSTGYLASRYLRKPLVGTFHTNVWEMRQSFPGRFLIPWFFRVAAWYNLGTYWRCDLTTAPTEDARAALVQHARKPFRRRIEVVPNGIEVARFRPGIASPDWRERCGLTGLPLVTFLGRLTADKGVHRFLDAVRAARQALPFGAIIAGAGPEEPSVRAAIRADPTLSAMVRYVGPVAEEEKPGLLAQSDVFVLPSTADTSSVALLEAMACGTACVASNTGGPRELVRDGVDGRLVSVLEPDALSGSIVELLDDPGLRARMGREAASHVRAVASIDATARRFISLYELVLSESAHRGSRQPG